MLQRLRRFAGSGIDYAFDLILPPVCVSCAALITDHSLLCPNCWPKVERIVPPVCDRLGVPLPGAQGDGPHVSLEALASPPVFGRARGAAIYNGLMVQLITRFKFEDRHEPLPLFLKLLHDAGRDLFPRADYLVPVPLHSLRLLQRRFNQSALFAKGLARLTGIAPLYGALKRTRRTKAQVGLNRAEREKNVKAAFAATRAGLKALPGKRVILIDDVMTTGATANACAAALLKAGAAGVDVLTLAKALPGYGDDR